MEKNSKSLYFDNAAKISCEKLGKIDVGQDGAIWGGYVFRIDTKGNCSVFELESLKTVSRFVLDKCDTIVPHSNSVCFGNEYFCDGDEFPLMYSNIYNNYQNEADRKEGMCCVYRIIKSGNTFTSKLVQIIKIGFTDDVLWHSKNVTDVRPYENFVTDNKNNRLYVFVMRDEEHKTRVFSFNLPELYDGKNSSINGVRIVELEKENAVDIFDCDYVEYMQGAAFGDGYIYSVNGFQAESEYGPTLSIIDTENKKTSTTINLAPYGLIHEPEFIDVYNKEVFFSDAAGNFYRIMFE